MCQINNSFCHHILDYSLREYDAYESKCYGRLNYALSGAVHMVERHAQIRSKIKHTFLFAQARGAAQQGILWDKQCSARGAADKPKIKQPSQHVVQHWDIVQHYHRFGKLNVCVV